MNRGPIAKDITSAAYRSGKFFNTSFDKDSVDDERNGLCLRLANGQDLAVVQTAGLVDRRIVCVVKTADTLETGERFGLIRFGAHLDVYLPPDTHFVGVPSPAGAIFVLLPMSISFAFSNQPLVPEIGICAPYVGLVIWGLFARPPAALNMED